MVELFLLFFWAGMRPAVVGSSRVLDPHLPTAVNALRDSQNGKSHGGHVLHVPARADYSGVLVG